MLVQILLQDISFYRHSNGGVTLSGGECTMYPDYLEALLKQLKANNIHTALETAGYFEYEVFSKRYSHILTSYITTSKLLMQIHMQN